MKIDLNPQTPPLQSTSHTSHIQVATSNSRIDDSFVTMAGKSFKIKETILGFWAKLQGYGKTAWEWVWWIVRLCPAENTRIEAIEEIIDSPESTEAYKDNPKEFLGEVIAATLLDPQTVDEKRRNNRAQVGDFVRKFKETVSNANTLLHVQNQMINKVFQFLSFLGLTNENPFFTFFIERPALIAGAMEAYTTRVLNAFGDREGEGLHSIRIVMTYFQRIAKAHRDQPSAFKQFCADVLARASFDIENIGKLAENHFDGELKPTLEEKAAFSACGENNHRVLHQLVKQPMLLHKDLEGADLGWSALYKAAFSQLEGSHFGSLTQVFKEDYPLAAEVCEQLQDIAKSPSQLAKVRNNLPQAFHVLTAMVDDYEHPPTVRAGAGDE